MSKPSKKQVDDSTGTPATDTPNIDRIYQQAPIGLCVLDLEYRFLHINERMASINGASVEEHRGQHIWDMLPVPQTYLQNIGERVKDDLQPVLNVDISFDEIHDDDRRRHHYFSHWHPLLDEQKTLIGFNIVLEDLTRQRRSQLRSSREGQLLRQVLDSIPIMISIWNKNRPGFRLNNHVQRITGYTKKELRQPDILEKMYPDPDYREKMLESMQDLSQEWREVEMIAKDGSVIQTLWYNMELTDELRIGIGLDNRTQKAAQRDLQQVRTDLEKTVQARTTELRKSNRELKVRSQQLAEMAMELSVAEMAERRRLSNALHDNLQQLLGVVKINLGMLSDENATQKQHISTLQRAGDVLNRAIEFTRNLSYELFPPILYKVGLPATLEWLAERMQEQYHLRVQVEHNVGDVEIDKSVREFLYHTAKELLYNVVKHAEVEEAHLSLSVHRGWILLVITDKGKGFDVSTLHTARGSDKGYGLFRLRERVALLRGEIKTYSTPDQGSRFEVYLPLDPQVPISQQTARPEIQEHEETVTNNKDMLSVIICDDHKIMREGLVSVISREADLDVVAQAENGQEAVDLAHELRPDIMIMDISMPILDGIQATERIRKELPNIKIIGLSIFEEEFMRQRMLSVGAIDCLSKSGPTDDLLRVIRTCHVKT